MASWLISEVVVHFAGTFVCPGKMHERNIVWDLAQQPVNPQMCSRGHKLERVNHLLYGGRQPTAAPRHLYMHYLMRFTILRSLRY